MARHPSRVSLVVCAALVCGGARQARAQQPTVFPSEGERWLTSEMPSRDEVDTIERGGPLDASMVEWRAWGEQGSLPELGVGDPDRVGGVYNRVRARLDYSPKPPSLETRLEADLLSGQIVGRPWPEIDRDVDPGTTPRRRAWDRALGDVIDPRALYAGWYSPVGLVRAGLQSSQWGLGVLANGGERQDEELFNQRFGGDRSLRLLLATTPMLAFEGLEGAEHLYVALGADLVWRDENASWLRGDDAYQGLMSVFWRDDRTFAGVYVVGREQRDRDGDELSVWAADASFHHERSDRRGVWELGVGGELAGLRGRTTRSLPLTGEGDEVGVRGVGAAGELDVYHRPTEIGLRLLTGYASGDANPDDDTLYRFRFDPNYKVGLILFDHYIPAVTRAWWRGASDPEQLGEPPRGVEQLTSDGGVENAIYLNPQITFGQPDELLTGVGVVRAWAAAPLIDPFRSFERGGQPTGVRGAPGDARDLGWEVDAAARYRLELIEAMTLEFKAEFGILFPGRAFETELGQSARPQSLARGRVALIF